MEERQYHKIFWKFFLLEYELTMSFYINDKNFKLEAFLFWFKFRKLDLLSLVDLYNTQYPVHGYVRAGWLFLVSY